MVRYVKKCVVSGCNDDKSHRHRFPNPKKFNNLFLKWVNICENSNLRDLSPSKIYSNYRVCHTHFQKTDVTTNMYLHKGITVPTQNLPAPSSTEPILFTNSTSSTVTSSYKLSIMKDDCPSTSKKRRLLSNGTQALSHWANFLIVLFANDIIFAFAFSHST